MKKLLSFLFLLPVLFCQAEEKILARIKAVLAERKEAAQGGGANAASAPASPAAENAVAAPEAETEETAR